MDSNEIIAMFDECTLPLSKARSLLRMLAVAINSRDPIHQEHLISGIEVIEELMEEGLKGLDVGLHQWSDAPAAATAKASSTIPATNEEKTMFSLANSEAINKAATMSSREVADLTGKQHKHVLDDCRKCSIRSKFNRPTFRLITKTSAGAPIRSFC